jgi:hypothetical protein
MLWQSSRPAKRDGHIATVTPISIRSVVNGYSLSLRFRWIGSNRVSPPKHKLASAKCSRENTIFRAPRRPSAKRLGWNRSREGTICNLAMLSKARGIRRGLEVGSLDSTPSVGTNSPRWKRRAVAARTSRPQVHSKIKDQESPQPESSTARLSVVRRCDLLRPWVLAKNS